MAETTSRLLGKQQQLQRLIERSLDNCKKIGRSNLTPAKIRSRTSSLKEAWFQYLNGHADLVKVTSEPVQASIAYFKDDHFEATQEQYQLTLDFMAECLEELEPPVSPNHSMGPMTHISSANPFSLSHLPPMNLPPFDGSYEQWEHFRDRFTSLIIRNNELRNFTRMHYLMSSLKGKALDCIKDLDVTAENFDVAWKTLTSRYENKRRLLNVHLSSLLNLSVIARESADDLQSLVDKVNFAVASLTNLDRAPEDLWQDMLVYIISTKLDMTTRKSWNLRINEFEGPPSFKDIIQFLSARSRALEEYTASSKSPYKPAGSTVVKRVHASTASSSVPFGARSHAVKTPLSCPLCKANHYLSNCAAFIKLSPNQRRELVRQQNRCFNCISSGHSVRECRSKASCRVCQKRHHTLLHASSGDDSVYTANSVKERDGSSANSSPDVHSCLAASSNGRQIGNVLLATVWVNVKVKSGKTIKVRALLDQGSEVTFMSENLAQLLRTKRFRVPISVSAVGEIHAGNIKYASEIVISPIDSSSPSISTLAFIMSKLTSYSPKQWVDLSVYEHLRDLKLSDENPSKFASIELIIGANLYNDILVDGLRHGKRGEPLAQNSIFGWFVSGPINSRPAAHTLTNNLAYPHISVYHSTSTSSLHEDLQLFWKTEEAPRLEIITPDEKICETHFQQTHSRSVDGRYTVRLPFKDGPPIDIGESKGKAIKLLESLHARLRVNSEHAADYREFIEDYERLGHMRKAPSTDDSRQQLVFIPHHSVLRADSVTSKLRVVFNASSRTSNGKSLNDYLLPGAKLQSDLPSVILRWRQFKFVYSADISKMYRQIRVDLRDVDYQRIVWKPTADAPIIDYQLLTVTYGMACALFLALRLIRQLTIDEGDNFPDAASILNHHVYVDDVLFGSNDLDDLIRKRTQIVELLHRGGFELRKWASNSSQLLDNIDSNNHGLACDKHLSLDNKLKILGIIWNPARDIFQYKVVLDAIIPSSKRTILSVIARLYDPLGWVTPVTIKAKILIQQLWKHQLTWDEPVSMTLLTQWTKIYTQIESLNELQVPRWIGINGNVQGMELHGFSDASSVAYAAAVYIKVPLSSGTAKVSLLLGKSKVAQLKTVSIPRLELLAAVLLSKLIDFVHTTLDCSQITSYCWTDSSVVLAWLQQHPSKWKPFVVHRVAEIQSRLPTIVWSQVPTTDNPSDCASRGLFGNELRNHTLWWHGPAWLALSKEHWPTNHCFLHYH